MSRAGLFLTALSVIAWPALPLAGQAPTSALSGVVRDSTLGPLPGVAIRAVSRTSGFAYATTTSSTGQYWLRGLPPDRYDVAASRIGLRPVVREDVELAVGRTVPLDFQLVASPVELEPLGVSVRRPAVETASASVSYVFDRERIERLSTESRQFMDLVPLVPGATIGTEATGGPPAFGGSGASLGALNRQSLGVLVDGGDFTEGLFGDLGGSVPLLAIQEFEVIQSQYSAEMGRAASGMVSVATRRGGNELRTEGFALFRHHALTARGAFESEKPDFNRSHWGVAAGGPIAVDRTHFFVAFERRAENEFSTVNTGGAFPDYEGTFRTPFTDNLMFARIDHRAGESHDFTLRYAGEVGDELFGVGGIRSFEYGRENALDMHSALLGHRWALPNGWVNQARVHFASSRRALIRNAPPGPTLLYPDLMAGPHQAQERSSSVRAEFRDDLSLITTGRTGTHRVRLGTHLSWLHNETRSSFFENGAFFFARDDAALPVMGQVSFEDPAIRLDARNLQLAFYAQDDWSPTPNLTLSLGLRYEVETNGSNQGFVSPFAGELPFIPASSRPIDGDNLAPRIGVAWDPGGTGSTVIRGGFGVFYDALVAGPLLALERSSGVPLAQVLNPGTTLVDELRIDPDTLPPIIWTAGDIDTPFTRQYSLGVEQVLPGDVTVRLDGVLVQGRNLLLQRNLNPAVGRDESGAPRFRFPGYSRIVQLASAGRAEAKMLLVEVRKAWPRGWLNVGYTLADRRNTNDTWTFDVPLTDPDVLDPETEWGPAAWDERHRLTTTAFVGLPGRVGLAGKVVYASGRPFTAITGSDDNGDFSRENDRPPGEGRNERRGEDVFRADAGLTWEALAWGRARIALTVNVYNLFNTVNGLPSSIQNIVDSPNFGRPLAAYAGRQAEIGLEVLWP